VALENTFYIVLIKINIKQEKHLCFLPSFYRGEIFFCSTLLIPIYSNFSYGLTIGDFIPDQTYKL